MFFPYEHIYVYAANYDLKFSIILFIIFFLILIFSIYIFFKNKDPYLLIIFTWISASLSVPILFGLIQQGFPLISNLAERYQYSSVVCIPIIVSWFLLKLNKNLYKNMFLYSSFSIILILSTIIQIDRSKVYINNAHFFTQAYYESPRNAHFYNFMVPKTEALKNQDLNKYLFFLHQLYSGDPKNEKWIFEYIKYFEFKNNKIGSQFLKMSLKNIIMINQNKNLNMLIFCSLMKNLKNQKYKSMRYSQFMMHKKKHMMMKKDLFYF